MNNKEKQMKKESSDSVKNLVNSENEKSEKTEKIPSDSELMKGLENYNAESLTASAGRTSNQIWKETAKASMNPNSDTNARKKLRDKQVALSSTLIAQILKSQITEAKATAKELNDFYVNSLLDFSNFTSISKEKNPMKYKKVQDGYNKMKILLNIK